MHKIVILVFNVNVWVANVLRNTLNKSIFVAKKGFCDETLKKKSISYGIFFWGGFLSWGGGF